jgi:uncharacterized sodium:solute symporter family permease YidK
VSLAEEGYTNGLAYGNFEWMASFILTILALFFAPFYIRSKITTLPDFLEKRFSGASRDWLSFLSIISAIFIHIGFSLFAGAVVIEGMFGIWYWCTDQTIVQRVLGAKDENNARIGPLFAGFIKILPVFLFVLPGLICLALINKGMLPSLPITEAGKTDTAQTYSHLISHILPIGLRGLVAAALLAALMSTVSGALNSAVHFLLMIFTNIGHQKHQKKKWLKSAE